MNRYLLCLQIDVVVYVTLATLATKIKNCYCDAPKIVGNPTKIVSANFRGITIMQLGAELEF